MQYGILILGWHDYLQTLIQLKFAQQIFKILAVKQDIEVHEYLFKSVVKLRI